MMQLAALITPLNFSKGPGDVATNGIDVVPYLLGWIVQLVAALAGAAAVIFIIIGGIQYINSEGNIDKIKQAKATIRNAILGLALAAGANLLVGFITHRFGF